MLNGIERIEAQERVRLTSVISSKACFELVWLCLVIVLYSYILYDVEDGLDWRYQFFFVEQICTIGFCTVYLKRYSQRIQRQTLFLTRTQLKWYDIVRSSVYAIEIILMIWVQEAVFFYRHLVEGDNFFLVAIAIGLYAHILFWGCLVFLYSFPQIFCMHKRQPPAYY